MPNQSALFTTNVHPGGRRTAEWESGLQLIGDFAYDVPLAFKLLLAGTPTLCLPAEPNFPDQNGGIFGEFDAGFRAFAVVVKRIQIPEARQNIRDTLAFLKAPQQRRRYLFLDFADLEYDPQEAIELRASIIDLRSEIESGLSEMERQPDVHAPKLSLWTRLKRVFLRTDKYYADEDLDEPRGPMDCYHSLGFSSLHVPWRDPPDREL